MNFIKLSQYKHLQVAGSVKLLNGAERIVEVLLRMNDDMTVASGTIYGRKDAIAYLVAQGKVILPLGDNLTLEMSTHACQHRLASLSPMITQTPARLVPVGNVVRAS